MIRILYLFQLPSRVNVHTRAAYLFGWVTILLALSVESSMIILTQFLSTDEYGASASYRHDAPVGMAIFVSRPYPTFGWRCSFAMHGRRLLCVSYFFFPSGWWFATMEQSTLIDFANDSHISSPVMAPLYW